MANPIAKRRSDMLLAILEDVAIDDARISKQAARGFQHSRATLEKMNADGVTDEQLEAMGFTREGFEVALEARRPRSEASYAVQMAHERTGMRIRQAVEKNTKVTIANIIMPQPQPMTDAQKRRAPVIDVTTEEK